MKRRIWSHLAYLISLSFLFSSVSYGWSDLGHKTVGAIAETHLSNEARIAVEDILQGESLADVSIWADEIKKDFDKNHTKYWHFVNFNEGEVSISKIPFDKEKSNGLFKLEEFKNDLLDLNKSPEKRVRALKYIVHIIGDLHQPFHAGFSKDRGGNKVKVKWYGKESNLHEVWDDEIIKGLNPSGQLNYVELSSQINSPTATQIIQWQNSLSDVWVIESNKMLTKAYIRTKSKGWESDYVIRNEKDAKQRILKAGVRLAGFLNAIFSSNN